jgi:ubiquinone/menaquinone biosynthesis C-methylase UbiE
MMEYVNCLLCRLDNTRLLVRKNTFNIVQCCKCGLVYVNPRPDEYELIELYNDLDTGKCESISISERDPGHEMYKEKKFQIAIEMIKKYKRNVDNVFDLGCSTGLFLEKAAQLGWTPYGSDVNRHLVEENRGKYGEQVKLQKGIFIDFPDQYFDVVTMFDTIEHLPDPVATLREVSRVLRHDGLVVITTPNVAGLFPKCTYGLFGKTLGAWEHPTPPGHIYQFSDQTLDMTLKQAGLSCVGKRSFEIYRPYTVSQLENSLINTLRGPMRDRSQSGRGSHGSLYGGGGRSSRSSSLLRTLRKLPRLILRIGCWGLVMCIYSVADVLRRGDSMVVVAMKQQRVS